jgi:hypothetical protein
MTLNFSFVDPQEDRFADAWRRHLAALNPECSLEHIQLLRSCEPDKEHYFVVGTNDSNDLVSVAYLTVQSVDVALGWRVRVLLLGGSTSAKSLWIDATLATYEDVTRELLRFCKKHIRHFLILLKPFESRGDLDVLKCNEEELNFINVYGTTQADVDISKVETYEAYLATLDKKKRYYLRKIETEAALAGLEIELAQNFSDAIPSIYPLYLSVSARAKEVKDLTPTPMDYFTRLAESKSMNIQAVLVRAKGRLIGFLILMEEGPILCCGACGMDHSVSKTYNVWYVLMLQAIKYGIRARKTAVILGTTNFAMKRKFAATRHDLWISIRFRSRALTLMLAPIVRAWLKKNVFVGADAEGDVAAVDAAG